MGKVTHLPVLAWNDPIGCLELRIFFEFHLYGVYHIIDEIANEFEIILTYTVLVIVQLSTKNK